MSDAIEHLAGPLAPFFCAVFARSPSDYLLAERPRRQVWNAVAAVALSKGHPPVESSFAHVLLTASAKSLIADSYGSSPPGFIASLGKLGSAGLEASCYTKLHAIMKAGGPQAKKLWHMKSISAGEIERLYRLLAFKDERLVETCSSATAARFLRWVQKQPVMAGKSHAVDLTVSARDRHRFSIYSMPEEDHEFFVYLWTVLRQNTWLFPEPPWQGSALLAPIRESSAMRKAGKAFRNCLRHHIRFALMGNDAYYLWNGTPPAIVQVKRLPPWGWTVWSMAGKDNEPVSAQTYAAIREAFAAAVHIFCGWDHAEQGNGDRSLKVPAFVTALDDVFGMELG